MELLGKSCAGLGDSLVVVLDLFALEHDRLHGLLAVAIHENRGNCESCLRVEVVGRIGYGNDRINVACYTFENGRIASDYNIVSEVNHLLCRRTSHCGKAESRNG